MVLVGARMANTLRVRVNGRWYTVEAVDIDADPAIVLVDGEPVEVSLSRPLISAGEPVPDGPAPDASAGPEHPPTGASPPAVPAAGTRVFASPMPGIIMSVAVKVGDQVVTGDDICVLEAMKMQQALKADWSGIVSAVHVIPGQQVLDGDPIVELQ